MDFETTPLKQDSEESSSKPSRSPIICPEFNLYYKSCKYLYEHAGCLNQKIEDILCPYRYYSITNPKT